MAASKFVTAVEEEQIIKNRLLTQISGSYKVETLNKLTKRFILLLSEIEKGSAESAEEALQHFVREVSCLEIQARKWRSICEAQKREQTDYLQKQSELEAAIEQARLDIETRKQELLLAKIERQHMEEYEVLRALIMEHPLRATTQQEIDRVEAQIKAVTKEGSKVAMLMQKRRKQFALLFHCIDELQRVGDEEEEEADKGLADAASTEGGPVAMDISAP